MCVCALGAKKCAIAKFKMGDSTTLWHIYQIGWISFTVSLARVILLPGIHFIVSMAIFGGIVYPQEDLLPRTHARTHHHNTVLL